MSIRIAPTRCTVAALSLLPPGDAATCAAKYPCRYTGVVAAAAAMVLRRIIVRVDLEVREFEHRLEKE